MLNDGGDDVDWTRVGRYLGNATGTRANFQGIYIDDFYVIMCTPDKTTYVRHASSEIRPCLHMDAMVAMRDAMREHAPKAQFLPLVYTINLWNEYVRVRSKHSSQVRTHPVHPVA